MSQGQCKPKAFRIRIGRQEMSLESVGERMHSRRAKACHGQLRKHAWICLFPNTYLFSVILEEQIPHISFFEIRKWRENSLQICYYGQNSFSLPEHFIFDYGGCLSTLIFLQAKQFGVDVQFLFTLHSNST